MVNQPAHKHKASFPGSCGGESRACMPYMVHTVCAGSRKGSVNVSMNNLSHVASSVEAEYMYGERKN